MSPRRYDLLWLGIGGTLVWGAVFDAQSFAGLRCGVGPWRHRLGACRLWAQWRAGKADWAGAVAVAQHGTDGQRGTFRPGGVAAWRRCVEPGCPRRRPAAWANDGFENRVRYQRQSHRAARSEEIVFARSHRSITIMPKLPRLSRRNGRRPGAGIFPIML
jgi:hypothetical protein